MTEIKLPEIPDVENEKYREDFQKELFNAEINLQVEKLKIQLEQEIKEQDYDYKREETDWDHEYKLSTSIHDSYIRICENQLDRIILKIDLYQKIIASVSTIYVGFLALSFSIHDGNPLPLIGIFSPLFLGLAFFLISIYAFYLTNHNSPISSDSELGKKTLVDYQNERRNQFIQWVNQKILYKRNFLTSSIISFGIGIITLPLAYLDIEDWAVYILIGCAVLVILPLVKKCAS